MLLHKITFYYFMVSIEYFIRKDREKQYKTTTIDKTSK